MVVDSTTSNNLRSQLKENDEQFQTKVKERLGLTQVHDTLEGQLKEKDEKFQANDEKIKQLSADNSALQQTLEQIEFTSDLEATISSLQSQLREKNEIYYVNPISINENTIAIGSDKSCQVWDIRRKERLYTIKHENSVYQVQLFPAGSSYDLISSAKSWYEFYNSTTFQYTLHIYKLFCFIPVFSSNLVLQ